MHYYEVALSSPLYKGSTPLIYQGLEKLSPGRVVQVPLKNTVSLGVVIKQVSRPRIPTKPITTALDVTLGRQFLQLLEWLQRYYPASYSANVGLFIPTYILGPLKELQAVKQHTTPKAQELPSLTADQRKAVHDLTTVDGAAILHGITGSGKTRIYLELAKRTLATGSSALILTPEIGLTPQLTQQFTDSVNQPVLVMHSNLTPKEKRLIWHLVATSPEPLVVIGPRSALFLPFKNLGLIVQDEFHDGAYKQEQAPYYLTSRVAAKLAMLHKAQLVLGSATPPVADYYSFESRQLPIISLKRLAKQTEATVSSTIVPLTDRSLFSRSPWLSDDLINAIEAALARHEQTLLFLNRRGSARLILCQHCGWESLCPRCDIPCTYHDDDHRLVCHTCGYQAAAPSVCPECGSSDIIYRGIGTKALAAEAERLFPQASVQRFDADNKKSERFEQHYADIKAGKVDILVGTQILTKGMDLPTLSVVGVVAADSSLSFPDFSAPERTFQQLTQVMGRVGRGHRPGTVIVQTFQPDQPVLTLATQKDYKGFYQSELNERRQFGFPPFVYLLHLSCARATRGSAQKTATKLVEQLNTLKLPVEILGPTPRLSEKSGGTFNWQIIVKAQQRQHLVTIIEQLPANWSFDIDPIDLL